MQHVHKSKYDPFHKGNGHALLDISNHTWKYPTPGRMSPSGSGDASTLPQLFLLPSQTS